MPEIWRAFRHNNLAIISQQDIEDWDRESLHVLWIGLLHNIFQYRRIDTDTPFCLQERDIGVAFPLRRLEADMADTASRLLRGANMGP